MKETADQAASGAESAPSRGRRRRWKRPVLLGVLLFGLALGLTWSQRRRVVEPLVRQRAQRAARELGGELTVASWGGDWRSLVSAHGVRYQNPAHVLRRASAERVSVALATWDWLLRRGRWLGALRAEGLALEVDLRAGGASANEGEPRRLDPEQWPNTELVGLRLDLILPGGERLELRDAAVRLGSPGPAGRPVALEAALARFEDEGGSREGALQLRASLQGPFLVLTSLTFGRALALDGGQLDLTGLLAGDGSWTCSLDGRLLRGSGRLELGAAHGERFVSGELERVDLGDLWRFLRPRAFAPEGTLSGRFHLRQLRALGLAGWSGPFQAEWDQPCLGRTALTRAEGSGELFDGQAVFERLQVDQGSNRATGSNLVLSLSEPSLYDLIASEHGSIELELRDFLSLVPASRRGGVAAQLDLPLYRARLDATFQRDGIALAGGSLRTRGGSFELGPGHVRWSEAGPRDWRHALLELDFGCDFRDLAELGRLLSGEAWSGGLSGRVRLSGEARDPVGDLELEGQALSVLGHELSELRARAQLSAGALHVQTAGASTRWGKLNLVGDVDLRAGAFQDLAAWLSCDDAAQLAPGLFERGRVELAARLDGPLRDPAFLVEASAEELDLGEQAGSALAGRRIERALLFARRSGDTLAIEPLQISGLDTDLELVAQVRPSGAGLLEWTGPVAIDLAELVARRATWDVRLTESGRVEWDAERVRAQALRFQTLEGALEVALERSGDQVSGEARFQGLQPMPLAQAHVPAGFSLGSVSGTCSFARSAEGLKLRSELELEAWRWSADGPLARARVQWELDPARLHLREFELTAEDGSHAVLEALLPRVQGEPLRWEWREGSRLTTQGRIADLERLPWGLVPSWPALAGTAQWELALASGAGAVAGALELSSSNLRPASPSRSRLSALGGAELDLRLKAGDGLELVRARLTWPELGFVEGSGKLGSAADLARALAGDGAGLRQAELALHSRAEVADASGLAELAGRLRRLEGRLTAVVDWSGTLKRPQPEGIVEWHDGSVRLLGELPSVENVQGRARLQAGRLVLESLTGELGAAPLSISGEASPWADPPSGEWHLSGQDVLLTRSSDLRLRGDLDLALSLGPQGKALHGEVRVNDGTYTRRHEFLPAGGRAVRSSAPLELFSITQAPFADLLLDVRLVTSNAVRIDNNLARGGARADLRLIGTGRSPDLTGAVFFESTRVLLPASTLRLSSGTATLDRRDRLVPRLDLNLEGRLRGYDVRVRVGGTLQQPTTELSSVPPLGHEDLVMLIASGQTPKEREGGLDQAEAARSLATYFGRDLLADLGLGGAGDDSLAERIEWQTGTDLTRSGAATAEVSLRLSPQDRERRRSVLLRAERDVYDRINMGLRFLFRLD